MIRSLGSTQSALNAYATKLNVTANNLANVNSEKFQRQDALINEGEKNQPQVQIRRDTSPAPVRQTISPEGRQTLQEMSNTDIAKEMTDMISTQQIYQANLKTISTADQMVGTILDIHG